MEELTKTALALFFDEEIYIIKDDRLESTPTVEIKAEPQTEMVTPPILEDSTEKTISLNYKGGNAKGIAIIINEDSNEFLNNTDETLLLNILKAIGLSLNDVAIINQFNTGVLWKDELEYTKALIFGILPSSYNIVSENYTINKTEEADWLFSDSLFSLGNNKVLKGKLWTSLQEFFM